MSSWGTVLADLSILVLLIVGIALFRSPWGARWGNATAAAALLGAMALVLSRHPFEDPALLVAGLLAGSLLGALVALRVTMIQIPAMVAFQHGAGGVAASAIAFVELTRAGIPTTAVSEVSGLLGLIIGAATFSGSMVASGKLAGKLRQTPTILPGHSPLLVVLLAVIAGLAFLASGAGVSLLPWVLGGLLVGSVLLGTVFAIRIGGADMPVLISFLNATAGLAAAFCGIVIQNRLLIACGATVAASGSILTAVMCKAMNRSFFRVLSGIKPAAKSNSAAASEATRATGCPVAKTFAEAMSEAKEVLRESQKIIIVPGYGMALARAQFQVAALAKRLEEMGKNVLFAIHPVAGRMPGHMNVLLAEAEVDYDQLREMDEINGAFPTTDAVLVVGACDVVNPAAVSTTDTPISGMPILNAHEARRVLVCNLDERPGYSGVPNPLYEQDTTLLLFGDGLATVTELLDSLPVTEAGE